MIVSLDSCITDISISIEVLNQTIDLFSDDTASSMMTRPHGIPFLIRKDVSEIAIGLNFVVMNGQVQFFNKPVAFRRLTNKRRVGVWPGTDVHRYSDFKKTRPVLYRYILAAISSNSSLFRLPKVRQNVRAVFLDDKIAVSAV